MVSQTDVRSARDGRSPEIICDLLGAFLSEMRKKHGPEAIMSECQHELVMATLDGLRDVIAVVPTGSGKSAIQDWVPEAEMQVLAGPPVVTVVLFPLLGVLEDRYQNLLELGYNVTLFHKNMNVTELGHAPRLFIQGELLRLAQPLLHSLEKLGRLARIVIDEVHVFQEDDEYRPVYADLIHLVTELPMIPVIFTTATLTRDMEKRLVRDMCLGDSYISIRRSANKPDHLYHVSRVDEPTIMSCILGAVADQDLQPVERVIVYCLKKDRCIEVQTMLEENGYSSFVHHSDGSGEERKDAIKKWRSSQRGIMVATKGFLEGINYHRIPLVIFVDGIISPIKMLQGAGRGGRSSDTPVAWSWYCSTLATLLGIRK
jgi:ATP-dependent DNA helicase RecQ